MRINRYKKLVIRKALSFKKVAISAAKRSVFKSKPAKNINKLAKMNARKAFNVLFKHFLFQLSIRPRIRLISKITLGLFIAFSLSSQVSTLLRAKEPEIKVNGQAILVAKEKNMISAEDERIEASLNIKRSPFDFKQPVDGHLSQGYKSYHRAFDIAAPNYSPIHPLGKGTVEFAGFTSDGKGNVVIVDHGDGLKSLYAHMSRINVSVGNGVESDTIIGNVGLTGRTTGPHVHLEIYDRGVMINPGSILPEN